LLAIFCLQIYELNPNQSNLILKLTVSAILPTLAGGLQTFVYLVLQQLFGRQLGHVLRYIDAPSQSATTQ
jgi:hypothetical protein